ncbi:MAG TPA: hypothetical protein VFC39_12665 [Acidobacteriaceae bacterium]|nr:hypothetical protein [Acidobacteriaceae bacterium]
MRTLIYIRSVLEIVVGVFFGIAAVRSAIMTLADIVGLFSYHSRANFENTAGDALALVIVLLLAICLLRDGGRVWKRAKNNPAQKLGEQDGL